MERISTLLHVEEVKCSCKKYYKAFFLHDWMTVLMTNKDKIKGKVYCLQSIQAHTCMWLKYYSVQNRVLRKLHFTNYNSCVFGKSKALDFSASLCNGGTMWIRARCKRRSGTADGYFNKAHGEDEEL